MMALSMRLHLASILLGLFLGCALIALLMRLLPAKHVRLLGLLVLLPGPALAFAIPELHKAAVAFTGRHYDVLQGALIAPAVMLPFGATLLWVPAGTTRAAIGLGANFATRARLIWLPLLLPAALLSFTMAVLLTVGCVILDRP
ncbi:hypothetical protein Gbfr_020_066 [Gluconobacter frateurii M-2]|nr:hypothetical protein Gbfr_020_066 [Gluconobacter frateurii M-2]